MTLIPFLFFNASKACVLTFKWHFYHITKFFLYCIILIKKVKSIAVFIFKACKTCVATFKSISITKPQNHFTLRFYIGTFFTFTVCKACIARCQKLRKSNKTLTGLKMIKLKRKHACSNRLAFLHPMWIQSRNLCRVSILSIRL